MAKGDEMELPYSTHSNTPITPTTTEAQRKHNFYRKELTVFLGEFIGTFMFLFLAFAGTQIALEAATASPPGSLIGDNPPPDPAKLLYIAFAFGVALAVNVAIFADVSGGMFNPAVTTALWVVGLLKWKRAVHSVFAQLLAGIAAAAFVSALLPGKLPVATVISTNFSVTRGLFLETFLTAQLILTILMLPAGAAKPMYIGMTLFIAEICSVYFTGGSLNPARSLGPAVMVGFETSHWIYWLGPLLGAGLAAGTFTLIKTVQGEEL